MTTTALRVDVGRRSGPRPLRTSSATSTSGITSPAAKASRRGTSVAPDRDGVDQRVEGRLGHAGVEAAQRVALPIAQPSAADATIRR
ncbi:hypothetical protein ACFFUA_28065 [Streptomyces heliomycini]|uniref:Uncharacterized protein n=1 Tax=Streptomyces heliomycini TaxID=284032 RepID=A0ABV5LGF1_9ACTN|nr:hypothetical protein [Streptomyces sp. XY152]KOV25506.1 hypothetical protein ADK58_16365 [Streptomyces sp. XY152]